MEKLPACSHPLYPIRVPIPAFDQALLRQRGAVHVGLALARRTAGPAKPDSGRGVLLFFFSFWKVQGVLGGFSVVLFGGGFVVCVCVWLLCFVGGPKLWQMTGCACPWPIKQLP